MDGLADYFLAGDRNPDRGRLQLVVDAKRAGGGLVTINVADAHAVANALAENDIEFSVDDTPSDEVLFGTVLDPKGNAITIVEPRT